MQSVTGQLKTLSFQNLTMNYERAREGMLVDPKWQAPCFFIVYYTLWHCRNINCKIPLVEVNQHPLHVHSFGRTTFLNQLYITFKWVARLYCTTIAHEHFAHVFFNPLHHLSWALCTPHCTIAQWLTITRLKIAHVIFTHLFLIRCIFYRGRSA
jgi:hypothetical protein